MKILEPQSAVLTNFEVYTHLSGLRTQYETTPKLDAKTRKPTGESYKRRGPGNYETVVKEVMDYLTTPPSPLQNIPSWNSATIKTLLSRLRPYDLAKAELVMILNLRPLDAVSLFLVVQEMYERFTEEQHEEMLAIIREVLGTPEVEEGSDSEETMQLT